MSQSTRPHKWTAAAALLLALTATHASAITLSDGNTSLTLDPTSSSGVNSWTIGGNAFPRLFNEWFWYRVGSTGPQASIDTLTLTNAGSLPAAVTSGDPVALMYAGTDFELDITFSLTSLDPTAAQLREEITVRNTGTTPLDFHLFEYDDFDIFPAFDNVTIDANSATQTSILSTASATVEVDTPADHFEAGEISDILTKLNTVAGLDLDNSMNTAGPADVEFAFQWDLSLPVGTILSSPLNSATIVKTKTLRLTSAAIPEPATTALAALGLAGIAGYCRRRPLGRR